MTTIQPAITPTTPQPAAPAPGPVVVISQPPPELVRLDAGTALEVLVVARDRQAADAVATAEARAGQALTRTSTSTADAPAAATSDPRSANAVIRTPAGDIAVRLPPQIDEGARLAIEILRSSDAQITARITTIDGRPALQVTAQSLASAEPLPTSALPALKPLPAALVLPPGAAWFAGKPLPITQLQALAAFVIAPAPTPAAGAPSPTIVNFGTGTELAVRVTQIQIPNTPTTGFGPPVGLAMAPLANQGAGLNQIPPPAPSTPAVTPTNGGPVTGTVPGTGPISVAISLAPGPVPGSAAGLSLGTPTGSPALSAGQTLVANSNPQAVESAAPLELPRSGQPVSQPPRPPLTVQPAPPIAIVAGSVITTPTTETAVIRTPAGDIQLATRTNLPVGTFVSMEVTSAIPPRTGAPPFAMPLATGPALPLSPLVAWPSVSEAIQILQRSDPQSAAQLLQAIPDGGPRTAAALMAFAHAMRSGDARAWPGDATLRGLERAGPRGAQLAGEISGEVRELATRANDTGGEWRTMPMPWNAEGRIDRIALIARRESAEDEDDTKKKGGRGGGTRFLINLELSRLGEMQLDGMFRRQSKSFDLMVRTKEPAPTDMVRDLPGLFANANAAMGLTGSLTFQVVKKFPDPTQRRSAPDRSGLWA